MIATLRPPHSQIMVYAPNGRLLRALGRKGAGPGEFRFPVPVLVTTGDTIRAFDGFNARQTVYAPSLEFVRTQTYGLFGGVLAEAVADVAFRLVPLDAVDAFDMIDDLHHQALLGAVRGEPAVDRDALASVLLSLSALAQAEPGVVSVDVNPLVIEQGHVVAVDALIEVAT